MLTGISGIAEVKNEWWERKNLRK